MCDDYLGSVRSPPVFTAGSDDDEEAASTGRCL